MTGPCLNVTPLTIKNVFPKGEAESLQVGEKARLIQATLAERVPSGTSISKLDISYLPKENVYIDVAPDSLTDTIGFGVRVQGRLMDKEEARNLVERIGKEITALVQGLE
ncbi:hypothetical protein FOXG_22939 [Fusarium oxysporum f. sp. lycopersici 4287]|uniref:Uncharacterized protein n=1 Tax=Fusarium oxysporum f. sp. lycopersici (strain 4287 / CBS 123668 / FGSC 9935 / NRRL 34936) TaxID=426428 RepID=A0A0J9WDH4_FUSO4|nr:uncharacterized protein FOXG_22939 [Fusarium oxysporum f. sp. lycopersici 4287]KNB20801.1 hypothetical protein FOXG_22939 [Fusarium oxysporum f. sp. lycopersici 4287]